VGNPQILDNTLHIAPESFFYLGFIWVDNLSAKFSGLCVLGSTLLNLGIPLAEDAFDFCCSLGTMTKLKDRGRVNKH